MKKILTAISAIIIVTAMYSCKDRSSGAFSGDVSTKKFMYQYADQRVAPPAPADSEYQNDADSVYISITLDLDLPQGNSIMAHRIREWVSEQVSSSILVWRIPNGQWSLVGYSPWGCKELDTTE